MEKGQHVHIPLFALIFLMRECHSGHWRSTGPHCQPCCTSCLSERHPSRWRQELVSHQVTRASFPFTARRCLRGTPPPLQSRTRSFINASAGRTSTPPPPCSPPLHFICVLFLGPLVSPFVAALLFLISLYLAALVLFILE